MNTLSNVPNRRGGTNPPNNGLISDIILKVQVPQQGENTNMGVSSFFIPIQGHEWFVLRATYNRVEKCINTLKANVACIYLPKHFVIKYLNGKKKRVREPLLPNLVFVYSTREHIEQVFKENNELNHFRFYRDKTKEINLLDEMHPPVIVPYYEMLNFIKLTTVESEHIKLVGPEQCHYRNGDKVRIVDGDFSGVEGRVARIAGQQRVVVEIQGVCMIATAYIPTAFLEKI